MNKRRTREQKIKAGVKTQIQGYIFTASPQPRKTKMAEETDKEINSVPIKKRIIKSLIVVSLILGIELVIYWGRFLEGR